jgi:hypothetical protein
MTHVLGLLVLAVLLILGGAAILVFLKAEEKAWGWAIAAFGVVALCNVVIQFERAHNAAGVVRDVRAFERSSWLVVVDQVELFDVTSILSKGKDPPWACNRMKVVDLAGKKEAGRFYFWDERVEVVGALDNRLLVLTHDDGLQLRHLPDGALLGPISALLPELRKRDPRLSDITGIRYDSTSGCLKAQAPSAWYLVHPSMMTVVEGTSCSSGSTASQARPTQPSFVPVRESLPAGAHGTAPSHKLVRFEGKTIGAPGGYVEPFVSIDARTGVATQLGSPGSVLIVHGGAAPKLTSIALDGTEGWTYAPESPPLWLVTRERDALEVIDGSGGMAVLDPTRGDVKERVALE